MLFRSLAEAANYAKQRGQLPAGMERLVDKLLKPRSRWQQLLQKATKPFLMPVDWTYAKPSKKSQILKTFMPSTIKEMREVEVLVDTSGSIGGEELSEFLSEIVGMAKSHPNITVWVSFCDTQIHSRIKLENPTVSDILRLKPAGGGGTLLENGLSTIKDLNRTVPLVCCLTDGCDSYKGDRGTYPFEVIWVLSRNGMSVDDHKRNCKYGTIVKMDGGI